MRDDIITTCTREKERQGRVSGVKFRGLKRKIVKNELKICKKTRKTLQKPCKTYKKCRMYRFKPFTANFGVKRI